MNRRGYSKAVRENLRGRIEMLAAGSLSGDQLIGWTSANRVDRKQPIRELLSIFNFAVVSDDLFKAINTYGDRINCVARGLDILLVHRGFRDASIRDLMDDLRGQQGLWVEAICTRLKTPALANLLTANHTESLKIRMIGWPPLSSQVLPYIPVHLHEDIARRAQAQQKLSRLYAVTAWPCCRELAKGRELDSLFAGDLGL